MHGPCLAAPSLIESPLRTEELESLRRRLFEGTDAPHALTWLQTAPPQGPDSVSGPLVGGCLAVLAASLGTPHAPRTQGAIFFVEDVDEQPYRLDRYLTQLAQAGCFDGIRALVFGHLKNCDAPQPGLLEQTLQDLFGRAPFPVLRGLHAGHGHPNRALPLGAMATLTGLSGGAVELRV